MSRQPPEGIVRTVERATELRAQGFTWNEVARFIDADPDAVRQWPAEFPEFWADRLAAARADLDGELIDYAKATLRRRIRSGEEKVIAEALKLIVLLITRRRPDDESAAEPVPEYRQLLDHFRGLRHDQVCDYLATQLGRLRGSRGRLDG
jgi:hypothetical protein